MQRIAALVLVLAAGGLTGCVSSGSGAGSVIVWGDSFAEELRDYGGTGYEFHAYGGTAPCDWLGQMRDVAATRPPTVAVMVFAGVSRPCTNHATGDALIEEYRQDALEIVSIFEPVGTRVMFASIPPGSPWGVPLAINQAWPPGHVNWSTAAAVTYPDGAWTQTLPCLPDEGAAHGCDGGLIAVRAPDGAHFCDRAQFYCSGARRFAAVMV